jgi:hypothetical protein
MQMASTLSVAIGGIHARYLDITRLCTIRRVGGGCCKVSGASSSAISDRPGIGGHEERARTRLPSMPI